MGHRDISPELYCLDGCKCEMLLNDAPVSYMCPSTCFKKHPCLCESGRANCHLRPIKSELGFETQNLLNYEVSGNTPAAKLAHMKHLNAEMGKKKCRDIGHCRQTHDPNHRRRYAHSFEEISNLSSSKPPCQYGSSCYRKNPEHLSAYSHSATPGSKTPCKYGSACYRKNPDHLASYSH